MAFQFSQHPREREDQSRNHATATRRCVPCATPSQQVWCANEHCHTEKSLSKNEGRKILEPCFRLPFFAPHFSTAKVPRHSEIYRGTPLLIRFESKCLADDNQGFSRTRPGSSELQREGGSRAFPSKQVW